MFKRVVTLSFLLLILVSCSNDKNEVDIQVDHEKYNGENLNIGVIGENIEKEFNKVEFKKTTVDSLKKNEEFDAFFITNELFEELSENRWTEVLGKIKTPIFFLNSNKESFIFRTMDMTYNGNSPQNTSNTGGFVFSDMDGMQRFYTWGYGDPSESTDPNDVDDWIYHEIFKDIEDYQDMVKVHKSSVEKEEG